MALRVLVDLSDANSSELIYTWSSNKKLLLRSLQVIERSLEDAFVDIMNRENQHDTNIYLFIKKRATCIFCTPLAYTVLCFFWFIWV